MGIEEFINEYDKAQNKETFLKKHVTTSYVPYERKIAVAKNIARTALGENFERNTPVVYMTFMIALVKEYTDIDIGKDESLRVFNALDEKDISEILPSVIGKDAERFNTVLKMVVSDITDNHNDMVSYLSTKGEAFTKVIDAIDETLTRLIETQANKNN